MTTGAACDACLKRTWLLARLAGHIELHRNRLEPLLALDDAELVAALAGRRRAALERELAATDPGLARRQALEVGLELICRCHSAYPARLADLEAPPAVLHVAGGLERFLALADTTMVAIVGSRRPSPYGIEVARALARGVAAAGVTVVSGMALGIDAAAHRGALEAAAHRGTVDAPGPTVAVLAAGAERAYPARARSLHARIRGCGAVVSELPPNTATRRWMFPARNRLIAALAALTVLVEARPGSGALVTARHATALGRQVGAVPGRITSPLAWGPHQLLRREALLIEGPEEVLDGLFGADTGADGRAGTGADGRVGAGADGRAGAHAHARTPSAPQRPALPPDEQALLDALAEGHGAASALARAGLDADRGFAALASLELAGRIRHQPGGRYLVLL